MVAVTETSGNSVELAAQLSKQKTDDDDDDNDDDVDDEDDNDDDDDDDNDDTRLLEAQKGFYPARTT